MYVERQSEPKAHGIVQDYIGHTFIDRPRAESAVKRLHELTELSPSVWRSLDVHGKAAVLNRIGALLAETYNLPRPPLIVKSLGSPSSLGAYGDGYIFDEQTSDIRGSDYGISLNEQGSDHFQRMFGDDPRLAVETYAHEFRHSYQAEQLLRSQKSQFHQLVDDVRAVEAWAHPYCSPNDDFDAYWNQPVERDARAFSEYLTAQLFGILP